MIELASLELNFVNIYRTFYLHGKNDVLTVLANSNLIENNLANLIIELMKQITFY